MKKSFKSFWKQSYGDAPWAIHLQDIDLEVNDILSELQNARSLGEMQRLNREKQDRLRQRDIITSLF